MKKLDREDFAALIELAKWEDFGRGDVTSEICIEADQLGRAAIRFRQAGVLCGMEVVREVLRAYDEQLTLEVLVEDGEVVEAGTVVGQVEGKLRSLLAAERVVLNFLQRLSGIATVTAEYVREVEGTAAGIYDTRKTMPGWRALDKYAVRCGSGGNHRVGLHDAVLMEDNHLGGLTGDLRGGLEAAMERLRQRSGEVCFVEVEVDDLEQLKIVLGVDGVDMVLLDNMTTEQLSGAVRMRDKMGGKGRVLLEASGNVNLQTVGAIAQTKVDRISVGALTHSVRCLDIGMDLEERIKPEG